MADRDNFANFIGVAKAKLPYDMDSIPNPKEFLVNLVRSSNKKHICSSILPGSGSTARVGPDYNDALIQFISSTWELIKAINHSHSLKRASTAIEKFEIM